MIWSLKRYDLPLAVEWKISRSSSSFKTIYTLLLEEGGSCFLGEVAFNQRFGETSELIESQFDYFKLAVAGKKLEENAEKNARFLDSLHLAKSLRFGIEMVLFNREAKKSARPIWQILGLQRPRPMQSSLSVPIMAPEKIAPYLQQHGLSQFPIIKLKIDQSTGVECFRTLVKSFNGKIRVDANESFCSATAVMDFLRAIDLTNVEFLEQPLKAGDWEEQVKLKATCPVELMADESTFRSEDFSRLHEGFDGANFKLMKEGSFLVVRDKIKFLKQRGLRSMIGCMIESSLGISAAYHFLGEVDYCDLDGMTFLQQDPYDLVLFQRGLVSLK